MRCIVTAGPTFEPLDQVRRLTNFSTGRLGCELAGFLTARNHEVILLRGQSATWQGQCPAKEIHGFTTTAHLREHLIELSRGEIGAVFHAAAVSDFGFGKVFSRDPGGQLKEVAGGKLSTREGMLLAELVPTPKIIAQLREWYPTAKLVGWKYEVEGGRERILKLARQQIAECKTDACVVNGAAYGAGFGLVRGENWDDLPSTAQLFEHLEQLLSSAVITQTPR
jgi:phosphopantothenate---cysteine ligase (CTP)